MCMRMRMRMRCVHGGVIENLDEQTRVVVTAAAFTAPASAIVATRPLSNSITANALTTMIQSLCV